MDQSRCREREESRSQHDRGKPENEIFTLRATTSKAFGGMPLHIFTINEIHILTVCVCVLGVRETEASPWQPHFLTHPL